MDVVVKPTGSEGNAWSLEDRLGRSLGTIGQSEDAAGFQITPDPAGGLRAIPRGHHTLDEAMTAIAECMRGACMLDSQS